MENRIAAGTLTDIGTEELAHLEMVATIICQLTKNLTPEEIKASGFDKYYIDHTLAIWPQAASGEPFSASQFQTPAIRSQIFTKIWRLNKKHA